MLRTNIILNEDLVANCLKVTGMKTKRALIDYALKELLRHEKQSKILKLKGNIYWEGDLSSWRQKRQK